MLPFLFYYCTSSDMLPRVYGYSVYYWVPVSLMLYAFAIDKGFISRLLSNNTS